MEPEKKTGPATLIVIQLMGNRGIFSPKYKKAHIIDDLTIQEKKGKENGIDRKGKRKKKSNLKGNKINKESYKG